MSKKNEITTIKSEAVNNAISTMSNLVTDAINHKIEVINTPDGTKYAISLATPTKSGAEKLECYDIAVVNEIATLQGLDTISETSETLKCSYLARVSGNGLFKTLGFSDIYDFASHVFGYARATTFQYVRVGLVFVDYQNEKPCFWSFLPTTFTKTHLSEILNAMPSEWVAKHEDVADHISDIREEVKHLLTAGVINANMSASAIRKELDKARGTLNEDGTPTYNLKAKKASKASTKADSDASEASETDENENDITPDEMSYVVAKAGLIRAKKSLEVILAYVATMENGETATGTLTTAIEKITAVIAEFDNK